MLFITQRLQAYFLKITSGRWPPFTSMHCCKRVWKLPYTRLRRSSSIAATSFQFLNSHDTPPEHTVFQEPPQGKIWYNKFGRPSRPSDVAETRDNSSEHCCTFQRSIATDLMKWPSLLYRSPSRQPRQAIAPGKYSNLKCVGRLAPPGMSTHAFLRMRKGRLSDTQVTTSKVASGFPMYSSNC